MKENNRGFSLVELIIVIAIMAILVGVMAPQLIKYVEKANISADRQLCDTVREAIEVAINDPELLADAGSDDIRNDFTVPNSDFRLDVYGPTLANSEFGIAVTNTLGFNPFLSSSNVHHKYMKSNPAKNDGILCCVVDSTGSHFAIYIANSDKTGKKNKWNQTITYDTLEDSNMISSK